jgi:hypothetical protein
VREVRRSSLSATVQFFVTYSNMSKVGCEGCKEGAGYFLRMSDLQGNRDAERRRKETKCIRAQQIILGPFVDLKGSIAFNVPRFEHELCTGSLRKDHIG